MSCNMICRVLYSHNLNTPKILAIEGSCWRITFLAALLFPKSVTLNIPVVEPIDTYRFNLPLMKLKNLWHHPSLREDRPRLCISTYWIYIVCPQWCILLKILKTALLCSVSPFLLQESTMTEESHTSSAAEISVTSNGDLDQNPETVFQRVRVCLEVW